jgi:hypothetical protein
LAVVVSVASVLQLHFSVHRGSFMAQGCVVVLAAIGVVNGLRARLFVGGVVVADAAVLKFGH